MTTDEKSSTKHLSFRVLQLGGFYYQDTVIVTMQGTELQLVKILTGFTSIDISSNHFGGEVPSNIGRLQALYLLNIYNNKFTGSIPSSIGNLTQLESLDMSKNKLVGEIPSSLTELRFLSVINLSYNQLEGKIPGENQFQTFESSSYVGNTRLCGFPVTKICSFTGVAAVPPASTNSRHNSKNFDDFISVGLGLVVGLGIFILPLVFSKRWCKWYYQHVDRIFFTRLQKYYERRNRTRRAYRKPIKSLFQQR